MLRPGTGLTYTGVATSAVTSITGVSGPIAASIPIKAGDQVGLNIDNSGLLLGANPGAAQDYWTLPTLADGSTRAGLAGGGFETLVQATIEPEPTVALSAKKKQKLRKAAITVTSDKASSASVTAKVKGSKSSKTTTGALAASTATKIKLKFSAKARKKILAAIDSKGARKVTATVVVSDSFGNAVTSTVGFKLTG